MSNKNFNKSEIIYTRLYKEYGSWDTIEEFMGIFGLTRQSYYDKKKSEKVDYDEIKKCLPDVNLKWLFSDNENDLKRLPVRNYHTTKDNFENQSYSQDELVQKAINSVAAVREAVTRYTDQEPTLDDLAELVRLKRLLDQKIQKLIK